MTAADEAGLQRVFFYGLFMDMALLERMGANPILIGPAKLPDYELRIGDRATLVHSEGAKSYGQLMDLPRDEVGRLYAGPGLTDYSPEPVRVRLLQDQSIHEALSYHLPAVKLGTPANAAYARRLADAARTTGFPEDYCRHIERLASD